MNRMFTGVLVLTVGFFGQALPKKPASALPVVAVTALVTPTLPVSISIAKQTPIGAAKSFKEWKNEKVQLAIKKVTITKAQIEYKKLNKQFLQRSESVSTKDIETDKLEAVLKNDLYSLEVAQELSVTDYFAIYLTKQDNKVDAYKEAAQKMTADEVNQLIRAYADSMFPSNGSAPASVKPGPTVGPTAMEKADQIH